MRYRFDTAVTPYAIDQPHSTFTSSSFAAEYVELSISNRPNGAPDIYILKQNQQNLVNGSIWYDITVQADNAFTSQSVLASSDRLNFEAVLIQNSATGEQFRWGGVISLPDADYFPGTTPVSSWPILSANDIAQSSLDDYFLSARANNSSFDDLYMFSSMQVSVQTVPLPGAAWLFISGIAGFAALSGKNKRHQRAT